MIENEAIIRFSFFITVFTACAIWEMIELRKEIYQNKIHRWKTNLAMATLGVIALQILIPVTATLTAIWAQQNRWGMLNNMEIPQWTAIIITIIILDMAIYWQHVLSHKIPVLWKFHKVHHTDRDLDVSSGVRFHPVEIMLSMIYKCAVIAILGAPPWAVFIFEIALNASAMFTHSNAKLNLNADKIIRKIFVTPDMHRVHHSVRPNETNTNFGFNLSIWDRIFKTYIPQPKDGHKNMKLGLNEYQNNNPTKLTWSLKLPFTGKKSQTSAKTVQKK